MTKARKLELRAVVVLMAGLLALATVWAQKSDPGYVQDDRGDGRDCPFKDKSNGADPAAALL
jgi:hypothetical protein